MEAGPRPGVRRTPESRFERVAGFPWTPHYLELEPGLRMAYLDTGPRDAAETLVLLHGEPTWGYLYRKMIAPFEDAGFRVVVPDLIGFGRSDKPVDPESYTYSQHVAWVTRLVAQLDLRGATFFGQDCGGLIGARVVATNESRFARVVFSNTGLPAKNAPRFPGLRPQQHLTPEVLQPMLGIDWRDTVSADDRIDPDRVHAQVRAGTPLSAEACGASRCWCRSPQMIPRATRARPRGTCIGAGRSRYSRSGARSSPPGSSTSCAALRDSDRSFRSKRRSDDPGL